MCSCFSHAPHPTGDPACNPGMCPDWELNQQPFGSQTHAQSAESQQPGLLRILKHGSGWCPQDKDARQQGHRISELKS